MSVILEFDFQKDNNYVFSEVNYLNYTKRPNFACDNYIFPKTRGNKNKLWTYSPHSVKASLLCVLFLFNTRFRFFI